MAVSQCIEVEIKGLQSAIKELHRKIGSEQKPFKPTSWKFPGKLAVEVDTDATIEEMNAISGQNEKRTFLLELLLDRLLLLLQVILYINDYGGRSASRTSIPLTFVTAARRLVKATNKEQSVNSRQVCNPKPSLSDPLAASPHTVFKSGGALTADSSSQTMETSFTVCAKCNDKVDSLIATAQSIGKLCYLTCEKSCILESEWKQLIGTGRFNEKRLLDAVRDDTAYLSEYYQRMDLVRAAQQDSIDSQAETMSKLEVHCSVLSDSVRVLEEKLEVTKCKYQKLLNETKQRFSIQLNEVSQNLHLEEKKSETLWRDVQMLQRLESDLKGKLTKQSGLFETLKTSYEEAKQDELHAGALNKELTTQLSDLQSELGDKQVEFERICSKNEETNIELKNTRTQVTNLNKKCKSLQCGQISLVAHISELDQECCKLKEHLELVKREKDRVEQQLTETKIKVEETRRELDSEKDDRARADVEKHSLLQKMCSLEENLRKEQLSKLMLMDYPYTDNIESLVSAKDHTYCVSANTMRILLLEEQNSELRKRTLSLLNEDKTFEVKHPIRLWQSPKHVSQRDSQQHSSTRMSPVKVLRGRLGHLVDALSTATKTQHLTSQSDDLFETFSCSDCDRMFTSHVELAVHACGEINNDYNKV